MNNFRNILHLSIFTILISCCAGIIATKSNAGETVINGSSIDSSTFSGNTFTPESSNTIPVSAPDTNLFVDTDGNIIISPSAQQQLNKVAKVIFDNNLSAFDDNPNSVSSILEMMIARSTVDFTTEQFTSSLQNSGVSRGLVNKFVTRVAGLFKSSTPNLTTNNITNTSEDLLDNNLLTNQNPGIYVDINQLNYTIKAYNNIVLSSDLTTLQNLSQNPDFLKINQILKELRVSVSKVN